MTTKFRLIPSIDQLRHRERVHELETRYGSTAVMATLREVTAQFRHELATRPVDISGAEGAGRMLEERAARALSNRVAPSLRSVINATGVIIHTNLGRAPLGRRAVEAVATIAAGYCNLEFDLTRGGRGSRTTHASALLQQLTGAERAVVVNNNAAAVLLTLAALASGREVIVSRGELVEIGGGFRIPDILRQSGATLREVGTTNRTRPEDYAAAINDRTAAILRVHPSNFRVEGFVERPALDAVAQVGRRFEIPIVDDLGSGNLYGPGAGLSGPGDPDEPTVRDSIEAGVAVCCVSGDKLLGGPQAGIVLGQSAELATIAAHPLMRAVRVDKLVYAALEATLIDHICDRAELDVPVTRMLSLDVDSLRGRAEAIISAVDSVSGIAVTAGEGRSAIGGGTTPGVTLASITLEVDVTDSTPGETARRLRDASLPVVGRIERDRFLLDLRTVAPEEDAAVAQAIRGLAL